LQMFPVRWNNVLVSSRGAMQMPKTYIRGLSASAVTVASRPAYGTCTIQICRQL